MRMFPPRAARSRASAFALALGALGLLAALAATARADPKILAKVDGAAITEDDYTRQFSEELRLASTGDDPLQWLVGGYYSSFGATSHVYSFYPATANGFNGDFGTTNLADNHRKVDIDQYAVFGEVSYLLPNHFKASLGARYYQYHSNSVTSVSGVSANGTSNGIVWGLENSKFASACSAGTNCQVLYAYDATDLTKMLYNSSQAANNRDVPGTAVKFTTPTIANGKVYVGSKTTVSAFGLLSAGPPTATAPTLSPVGGTYASAQSVSLSDTTPGAVIYYTTDGTTPTTASAQYSNVLAIASTTTVKAIAVATGYMNSAVTSATYTINLPVAATPSRHSASSSRARGSLV